MKKTEKIKIVVVDDAPFIREIVRMICASDENLSLVAEAENGEEALEIVSKYKPDVVLMDMVMPKVNGIQATTRILEKFPNTRIIAFSTLDQEGIILKALEVGCCNFLAKPFEGQKLKDVIYKSINGEQP